MKIGRFIWQDRIMYGCIDGDDVYSISGDIFSEFRIGSRLCKADDLRFIRPTEPRNAVNIGLIYADTLAERRRQLDGLPAPSVPIIFLSAWSSLSDPGADVVYPTHMSKFVRHAAEPVAVIGKKARNIPLEAVKDHIFGYTCGNDISALDVSDVDFNRTGRPHNFDGFSPFGPFIETDVDGDELTVRSAINGVTMVERSTRDMIYDVSTCIHTITQVFTLYPGDIVFLGSVKSFPFEIGDTLEVDIKDVGVLRNHVAAPR